MKNLKQEQALLEILGTMVIVERTFSAIENITAGCDLTSNLLTWYPLAVLMGVDLDQENEASEKVQYACSDIYIDLVNSSLSVEDTAMKIYEGLTLVVDSALQEFPFLKMV